MLKKDVVVGAIYLMKVSGNVVPVYVERETTGDTSLQARTNWIGQNLKTKRQVRIKSAAKLRKRIYLGDLPKYGVSPAMFYSSPLTDDRRK
jgi:hypothetical protein